MIKHFTKSILLLLLVLPEFLIAQNKWIGKIHRQDGNDIRFVFDWKMEKGKPVWYVYNAEEKIRVNNISKEKDSLVIQMPVFESQFRLAIKGKNKIEGNWIKGGAVKTSVLAFFCSARC